MGLGHGPVTQPPPAWMWTPLGHTGPQNPAGGVGVDAVSRAPSLCLPKKLHYWANQW